MTVIVKLSDEPGQLFAVGVTVIVETTSVVPELTAVKAAMSPEPLAANPIEVSSFVQLKVVPATAPLKLTAVVFVLLHNI